MNEGRSSYKRMGPGPIMNFVIVKEFDSVLLKVTDWAGRS